MAFKLVDAPNKPRRLGVVTAVCSACLTPNGVRLGLHYHSQTALYKCYNPECGKFNRVVVTSQPVAIRIDSEQNIQQGVKVGGLD